MKIFSITQENFEFCAFEVEISLMPGLPQISILGQADSLVKESIPKIQSAIKSQGFQLPRAQHILVDLKPQHVRKNNSGLELAIATAILQETRQIKLKARTNKPLLVVGNLSLKGEVFRTRDSLTQFNQLNEFELMVGPDAEISGEYTEIKRLRDLKYPRRVQAVKRADSKLMKPPLPKLKFAKSAANLMQILAVGEHACLIAGAKGTGKSTIIATIPKMIEPASENDSKEIQRIQKFFGQNLKARPQVNVHHSISTIAFLGGGSRLHPGEITRAHKGTLIMDEFMQFDSEIQDGLRDPLEKESLTIARNGEFVEFPAEVFLLATTNLCHCGQFAMNSTKTCSCSKLRLRQYLSRFVGPCLDRFQALVFSSAWEKQEKEITAEFIFEKVERAIEFRLKSRNQTRPNGKASIEELSQSIDHEFIDEYFKINFMSERRQLALKRISRTIADLDASERVRLNHVSEALGLSVTSFRWLEQAQGSA